MHAFHCTSKQEPTLTEHYAFRWLNFNELENLDWATANVSVVKLVLTILNEILVDNFLINVKKVR
jgi:hypothetical protein